MTDLNNIENLNTKPLSPEGVGENTEPVSGESVPNVQPSDTQVVSEAKEEVKPLVKADETKVLSDNIPSVGYAFASTQDGTPISMEQMIGAHKNMGKSVPSDQA